jgi:hypothetical protein
VVPSARVRIPVPALLFMTRTWKDFFRKFGAVVLVLTSLTIGIIGLGIVSGGTWWGAPMIAWTPVGIWLATRLTPEGGTSGYCDENL